MIKSRLAFLFFGINMGHDFTIRKTNVGPEAQTIVVIQFLHLVHFELLEAYF